MFLVSVLMAAKRESHFVYGLLDDVEDSFAGWKLTDK
jgi:hypothetical protein